MMGDYPQALTLNQEVIDYDTARSATLDLSITRFQRAEIENARQHYGAAIEQLGAARALSVAVDDRIGIAFADSDLCRNRIELGELEGARQQCTSAERSFASIGRTDELKDTQALLARIDLLQGQAERARATLDKVLEHGGVELMSPRIQPSVYELRARTNAALHDYPAAYRDLDEYLRRFAAENEAQRVRQEAALRARFKTDQEIERNASLQRELALTRERSERQRATLRWIAVASIASMLVIVLLTWVLVANLRFRRQLVRLAGEDSLTGLPNRGRTAELAAEALAQAQAAQRPLTIALLDMDRFKEVNDRFGHAAGDYVLKEFARVSRLAIRARDILGRWGGEEFLLVLPDVTLDAAVASVERLRTLAGAIELKDPWQDVHVSFSAGLAVNGDGVRTLDDLIGLADAALYQAKHDGRDLVRIADGGELGLSSGTRRALRLSGS
jgi:diguanylate cyclase (GGDEF)-like protein